MDNHSSRSRNDKNKILVRHTVGNCRESRGNLIDQGPNSSEFARHENFSNHYKSNFASSSGQSIKTVSSLQLEPLLQTGLHCGGGLIKFLHRDTVFLASVSGRIAMGGDSVESGLLRAVMGLAYVSLRTVLGWAQRFFALPRSWAPDVL